MNIRKILVVTLVLVLALSVFAVGCKAAPKLAETQALRMNIGTEPPQLNSTISTDTVSFNILRHTIEGLTRLDANDKPIPGIAEKWTTSADGLTWTFTLRDAKWSDGTAVTAADFEFAWKTLLNPETASEYAYFAYILKGGAAYNAGEGSADDVGVEAVDAKTLKVTLSSPIGYFLDACAFGVMLPVNQAFYEKVGAAEYGSEFDKLLYNGAFVIDSWTHEQNISLKKNETYWDAKNVFLNSVSMDMITDTQAAFTKFLAGDYDIIGLANVDYITQSEAAGFTTKTFSDGATFYLEFNLEDPAMANANIRTAITYALDRQSYISKIVKDKSVPALAFVNPEIKGSGTKTYREEVGNLIEDNQSTKAKELFAKGLQEIGQTSVSVSIISDDSDLAIQRASALAESLTKNLGIEIKVDSMPFKSRLQKMQNKEFQIVYAGWGPDYNDPMTFLDMFETGNGNNHTSYSSAAYDALLASARTETNNAKRYDIYKQMETLLMKDLPIAPVFYRIRSYTTVDNFMGISRGAFADLNFRNAYFEAS